MSKGHAVPIAFALVLLGLAVAASLAEGVARIGFSATALAVIAAFSRAVPAPRGLPHPAAHVALSVLGGVGIVTVAFGVYLVIALAGPSLPVLVGVAVSLTALCAFLVARYGSQT